VNANRNRFKLRLRFYDENSEAPVFLELKRRINNCILKQRCGIPKSAVPLVLAGQLPVGDSIMSRGAKGRVALVRFVDLLTRLDAKPKALVTYLREAYINPDNEGVRLTLDRQVRIAPRSTGDFSLAMDRYVQPFGDRVILELKYNTRFPVWFGEMVRSFNLTRSAAAKYCEGVAALWNSEHATQIRAPIQSQES
jgi:hypothetical protein